MNKKLENLYVNLAALKNLAVRHDQPIVAINGWIITGLLPNPGERPMLGIEMLLALLDYTARNAVVLPPRLKGSGVIRTEAAIPAF